MKILADFISLFFPRYCISCYKSLYRDEKFVCLHCLNEVAKTHTHKTKDNFIERKFYGKVPLKFAYAYLYFQQSGVAQNIIHHIKYEGREELAHEMGKRYALEIKEILDEFSIDYLTPVPLHRKKQKIRGYNQSMKICEGMNEVLNIPILDVLERSKETATQTKKSRIQRWRNVDNIFKVKEHDAIEGKTIVIVDDVITTGATLEACINALLKHDCNVGVLALAAAK